MQVCQIRLLWNGPLKRENSTLNKDMLIYLVCSTNLRKFVGLIRQIYSYGEVHL